ncbi:MAG: Rieske 2Fe-2S domain-containing protein [Mucilaginibacter sp.]|nr:Rieske 2Fe-2S domain-containing protein [Mucilaginibacter sp.]
MERQEFLSKLGIGLMAVCAGCSLVACGGKSSNPGPSTGGSYTPPPSKGSGNLFTADLNTQLVNVGDSVTQQGVILVRINSGNTANDFTAVQVACTHQGNSIGYNNGQGIFICPAHGSEFSKTGAVLQGPATLPLQRYTVTISGSTLTVSA